MFASSSEKAVVSLGELEEIAFKKIPLLIHVNIVFFTRLRLGRLKSSSGNIRRNFTSVNPLIASRNKVCTEAELKITYKVHQS